MKKKVKRFLIIFFVILIILIVVGVFLFFPRQEISVCNDGTSEGNCSLIQPYFCFNGSLIEKASTCGCSDKLELDGEKCVSEYQTGSKNISLNYILRGKEGRIDFEVYEGMYNYISALPNSIYYLRGKNSSRLEFKLRKINEEQQREFLLPLVVEIENVAENEADAVRIAVSIVQNILYGESDKQVIVGFNKMNYSRYAYETLYEMEGACEGRSELLVFLLREMGYEVILFYFPLEDHEAVGVKCPLEYSSYESGYCFIETTGVSIISNDEEYYLDWGRLESEPEVLLISKGKSLPENLYEYKDAQDFIELEKIVEETGELNIFRHYKFKFLKEKYGLENGINL